MTHKSVHLRETARNDIDAALDHYLREASRSTVDGFILALETAFAHIAQHPASGSPRYAEELALPGLRSLQIGRYPYLAFYIEHAEVIDVWRILHVSRDIPNRLRGESG